MLKLSVKLITARKLLSAAQLFNTFQEKKKSIHFLKVNVAVISTVKHRLKVLQGTNLKLRIIEKDAQCIRLNMNSFLKQNHKFMPID